MLASAFDMGPYASLLILIVFAVVAAIGILILAHLIGTSRTGVVKDETYESGMPVIGDARRRFNVRFYVVAILFLLFDVEVVLLWPWAPVFYRAAVEGKGPIGAGKGFLLVSMGFFFVLLLVGFVYEWRKGVFKWD
jgi:NADH-quinone oxidoreductase subunit A